MNKQENHWLNQANHFSEKYKFINQIPKYHLDNLLDKISEIDDDLWDFITKKKIEQDWNREIILQETMEKYKNYKYNFKIIFQEVLKEGEWYRLEPHIRKWQLAN